MMNFSNSHSKRFDMIFRVAVGVIAISFTAILLFWGALFIGALTAADQISEVGVRGVVHQIWCGKTPNCSPPL